MFSFLPNILKFSLENINENAVNEIRLRVNAPIVINSYGNNKFLTKNGLSNSAINAIICQQSFINEIILNVSNNCLYSINDQLINGFITTAGGIRIGVAGEIVYINNQIKTIKNISSLNIRIPHLIENCSLNAYLYLINCNTIRNTLILSPAGAGKTTFLRDFTQQIVNKMNNLNVLVADERCELCSKCFGENNISNKIDVYSNCSKKFAFENGIRSMKPDVIITDELNFSTDIEIIENAITCGVNVVASIHAKDIYDLKNKPNFQQILSKKLFNRFVVLSNTNGPGTIEGIFDENLNRVG